MKKLILALAFLIPSGAFGWETATQTEIVNWLNANYAWWGNVKDGSAHGTYVERSVDTAKLSADASISFQKLHFTFNTSTGLYRWMNRNPLVVDSAAFQVQLETYLNTQITNGTIEAWDVISSNHQSEFAVVKAWMGNPLVERVFLLDKANGTVQLREVTQ